MNEKAITTGDNEQSTQLDVIKLINQMADPAILVGVDRVIEVANDRVNALFGWQDEGLQGQQIDILIPPAVRSSHPDWVAAFFERPASRSMSENARIEGIRKNGERVPVTISLTPVQRSGDNFVPATIQDISKTAERYSQRVVELAALTEISTLTKTGLSAQEIVQRVSRQVRNLVPYDRFAVVTFDLLNSLAHDWFVTGQTDQGDNPWDDTKLAAEQLLAIRNLKEPFIWRHETDHAIFNAPGSQPNRYEQGYRSLLCAPLIWNDEVLGVVNFRSKSETAYGDESLRIADQISTVIATAISQSNIRTLSSQVELERSVLARISKISSNSDDIGSLFDQIAVQVDHLIPIDRMAINSVNIEANRHTIEAQWGYQNVDLRPGIPRPLANTVTKLASDAGETIVLPAEQSNQFTTIGYPEGEGAQLLQSWMAAPMILRGQTVGVMHFRSYENDIYTEQHRSIATQISSFFTASFANSTATNDSSRERQVQNSVNELNRVVIDGGSLEQLASRVYVLLQQLVEFDRFSVVSIDADKDTTNILFQEGQDIFTGGSTSDNADSIIGFPGSPYLGDTSELPTPWRENFEHAGLNSWMYLAIGEDSDTPIASIWVSSKQKSAYNSRDLEILERLGGVLAPVLHHSALENTRRELSDERGRAEILSMQAAILESEAKAKSEFISSISHEFKTPLTSVVAFSSLLKRDKSLSERQTKQLDIIQNNAWRLERMIDDLLHLAAADSGGLSYDIQKVAVIDMVKEVCDGLKPVANSAGKRLVWRSSQTTATAAVDAVRLAQAVQNIVSNAIKYSPSRSGITVSTCEIDGNIEILVRNKGLLSGTESEQAFSRFTRLDNEMTRRTPGTGLGLSITRDILDEMGGTITLESDQKCIEAKIRIPVSKL